MTNAKPAVIVHGGAGPIRDDSLPERLDGCKAAALAAGMVAVHLRRGPWGYLHEPPRAAIRVRSLAELPGALAGV